MGGFVLYFIVTEVLETALVGASSAAGTTDEASYFAARNTPAVLGAKVAYNTLTAVWSGYMTARLAGERETHHGAMAAVLQTLQLLRSLVFSDFASFTPAWMRVFLLLSTGPATLAGAWVRGRARVAQEKDPAVTPEEPQ
jgi:hypothetical protein